MPCVRFLRNNRAWDGLGRLKWARFPSVPVIKRVPLFLVFDFIKETIYQKGQKGTTGDLDGSLKSLGFQGLKSGI